VSHEPNEAAKAIGWISVRVLARDVLGMTAKNLGRAGRDWCQARGVPYKRDGRVNLVRIVDVRNAIERLGAVTTDRSAAVNDAVARMQRAG
jgi:hypothetical protein